MNLWIDIINPSHALFFNSLVHEIKKEDITITIRDRAETKNLSKSFGLQGKLIGKYHHRNLQKIFTMGGRTIQLFIYVPHYEYSISFENAMSVLVSKLKKKPSILLCDNDLKYKQHDFSIQNLESKVKTWTDYLIIPEVCKKNFEPYFQNSMIFSYNGYKEDIYLANYTPDPDVKDCIPYEHFIIIRPEALESFYVSDKKSIIPELLPLLKKENINIVYLPRDKNDNKYVKDFDIFIPRNPLNGLDLCYYSDAVLTGSGTMAREAACMGKPAVSFFPEKTLLTVDESLKEQKKLIHSRDPHIILDYILSQKTKTNNVDIDRCKQVKNQLVKIINNILNGKNP